MRRPVELRMIRAQTQISREIQSKASDVPDKRAGVTSGTGRLYQLSAGTSSNSESVQSRASLSIAGASAAVVFPGAMAYGPVGSALVLTLSSIGPMQIDD